MATFITMESSRKFYNCNRSISDITNHAYQHKRRKLHKSMKSPLYPAVVGIQNLLARVTTHCSPMYLRFHC
ncbi:hypothetical protein L211DRAFT_831988 [Terfezia boudieri ATCC MYA-4762]|uniref:Uncharacterized protein n=1 Tax=Terfezia boudieri ATCC MYA-4762 TaxID=1051890 RepID=A0A3N4MAU4_9PEZI|nr:hypothetical protein L211DRAFT_831988 [Terfezia boudieri ATCC MYA-4762]